MYGFIVAIHIIAGFGLILVVLLQSGKGAGVAGLFGGGSSNEAIFGGTSTPLLIRKITISFAVILMVTSLSMNIVISKSKKRSVAERIPAASAQQPASQAPAAPAPVQPVAPAQK